MAALKETVGIDSIESADKSTTSMSTVNEPEAGNEIAASEKDTDIATEETQIPEDAASGVNKKTLTTEGSGNIDSSTAHDSSTNKSKITDTGESMAVNIKAGQSDPEDDAQKSAGTMRNFRKTAAKMSGMSGFFSGKEAGAGRARADYSSKANNAFNVDSILSILLTETPHIGRPHYKTSLKADQFMDVAKAAREVFLSQSPLLEIEPAIRICGDIHGQYQDLIKIFDLVGRPPESTYLFLGDYVDRGLYGLEVITLLFCYKIKYPNNIYLLRGNHECASITKIYGFYDECKRRTSVKTWKTFVGAFDCMPVAAIVGKRIFCVHGGISPHMKNFDQIRKLKRPMDIPDEGIVCDLLWSDPDSSINGWSENYRGVSYVFGYDVICSFQKVFGIDLICRAHQVVEDGYKFEAERSLVTIFSAPNYCGQFDNAAAVLTVSSDLVCKFHIIAAAKRI